MSDLEIYRLAREFFEESTAVNQVLKRCPKDTSIGVLLDGRFEAQLFYDGNETKFLEGRPKSADFQLDLSSEALRRMASHPPDSLSDLLKEFLAQGLRRGVKWRVLSGPKALLDKGYLQTIKDLSPLIQGEAAQSLMIHAGKALAAFEDIKARFRPKS
jgi:hypothetical protein